VRQAAAAPGYSGPDVRAFEQIAAGIAKISNEIRNWGLDEQLRRASRPRRASRGQERAVRQAIAGIR
jgi:hypothetical protein